jgi:hypothetical protein
MGKFSWKYILWENSHAYIEISLEMVKIAQTFNVHSGQGVTVMLCCRIGVQIMQNILRKLAAKFPSGFGKEIRAWKLGWNIYIHK